LDDGSINDFGASGFNNDSDFNINDFYIGALTNISLGKFEIQSSLFAHNYSWRINNVNSIKKNKWVLLPNFQMTAGSGSSRLRLNYGLRSSFSDVASFSNRYYLRSYNSAYLGNNKLENELYHSASINYTRSNLFRGTYFLGTIRYSHKLKGIISSINTDVNRDNYLTSLLVDNPYKGLNGTFVMDKRSKLFRYRFKIRLSAFKSIEDINSNTVESRNRDGTYDIYIQTRVEKFPKIKVGFKQSLGDNLRNQNKFKYVRNQAYTTFNHTFLKKYLLSFDYTHTRYRNKSLNATNIYSLMNAKVEYDKESSPWSFILSANNLFDVRFKNQNSLNTYIISESRVFVLPRIAMVSIKYKL
jgi:hypothetical protein